MLSDDDSDSDKDASSSGGGAADALLSLPLMIEMALSNAVMADLVVCGLFACCVLFAKNCLSIYLGEKRHCRHATVSDVQRGGDEKKRAPPHWLF